MEILNKTEAPVEIFRMVLRSLESHRPAKAETDLLDMIRERYGLKADPERWPDQLFAKRVSVEEFLKYTLDQLAPFVEMVLDIYDFLYAYVSTTGGRTQHFVIASESLTAPWSFDVSRLPRELRWIQAWMNVSIEEVTIDWKTIGDCLRIDNGVFYGSVEEKRLIQSLIIARREQKLPGALASQGDLIHEAVKRAARAWYAGVTAEIRVQGSDRPDHLQLNVFLPSIGDDLRMSGHLRAGKERTSRVGIDLDLALIGGPGSHTAEEVFRDQDSSSEVTRLLPDLNPDWAVEAVVFFGALWGLDDPSFRRIVYLLKAHEERNDLLRGTDLEKHGARLAEIVLRRLTDAVKPTGRVTHRQELGKQQLEILLLPYWKDRWFLFEVWTLIQVLRRGTHVGAALELAGVSAIADPDTLGTVWHLPTQKAKSPVAVLSSPEASLPVWFQRETRRLDSQNNMEPDIRLTAEAEPYLDLAIVECKDRIKFRGAKADTVVDSYLKGSQARLVWLVNYEDGPGARSRTSQENGRAFGVAEGFRPQAIPHAFRASLDELIRTQLKLRTGGHPGAMELSVLVIDVSGSMSGKELPDSAAVRTALMPDRREFVKLWSHTVEDADFERWRELSRPGARIHGSGAEDGRALETYARTLPEGAMLTVITDASGRMRLLTDLGIEEPKPPGVTLGGHSFEIILI
jgi:hypothetical protein